MFIYAVECAASYVEWCDANHARGAKTYDCLNVVSIDTSISTLKLVRIGNNRDHHLRKKDTLCYNYRDGNIIYNS